MNQHSPIVLSDVLDKRYVDTEGAARMAGLSRQTLHNIRNGQHSQRCPMPEPVFMLAIGKGAMIFDRKEIEAWVRKRKGHQNGR